MGDIFSPAWGLTFSISNSVTATAAVNLPVQFPDILISNTSSTAVVYVSVTGYEYNSALPTGTAPVVGQGMPIMPLTQIRFRAGTGNKVIRTIASAADGATIITPGTRV